MTIYGKLSLACSLRRDVQRFKKPGTILKGGERLKLVDCWGNVDS